MSFWRTFGFHTVSVIDSILERDDFTLVDLLNEDEILQEVKSQNKKLLDFLCQEEVLEQLFDFITTDQDIEDESDSKRKFKYPFLACEILCSEVWSVCEAVYDHPKLLDKLYGFLDREPPLPPLLSNYVSRVAGILLQRKITETIEYLKSQDDVIGKVIKHLGTASVMDLLLKIIGCEETAEGSGILEWLTSTNLIPRLVEKFNPNNDSDVHENVAQALVDIIAVSMTSTTSPLMAHLESEETVRQLFDYILGSGGESSDEDSGVSSSTLLHGLSVLIELMKRTSVTQHDDTTTVEQLPPLLRVSVENLDKFNSILTNNPSEETMRTTFGELSPPFGFQRLKVIEFFVGLVRTDFKCIDDALIELNVFSSCLQLFFQYQWNNFLHYMVEQLILTILEGENESLKLSLFTNSRLAERIIEATEENAEAVKEGSGNRRGYMGYLTSIASYIQNASMANEALHEVLESNAAWVEYVSGPLAEIQQIEEKPLGGHKPASVGEESSEDEDMDFASANTEMVFQQYLQHHQALAGGDFPDAFDQDEYDEDHYEDEGEIVFDNDFDPRSGDMDAQFHMNYAGEGGSDDSFSDGEPGDDDGGWAEQQERVAGELFGGEQSLSDDETPVERGAADPEDFDQFNPRAQDLGDEYDDAVRPAIDVDTDAAVAAATEALEELNVEEPTTGGDADLSAVADADAAEQPAEDAPAVVEPTDADATGDDA